MARRRDIPHSQSRIKQKRRRTLWKFLAIFFAVILVVGGVAWGFSRPQLRIARIDVNGNNVLGTDEITSFVRKEISGTYFFLFPKNSIVLYPKERIKSDLLGSFKRILSIEVSATGLTTLSITINERKPYSLWCGDTLSDMNIKENSPCYFMDQEGFLFAEAPRFSDNVYTEFYGPLYKQGTSTSTPGIISTGSIFLPLSEFKTVVLFQDLLGRIGFHANKTVALDAGDFAFVTREGGRVLINKKQDPMKLVSDIESALRAEFGDPANPLASKQIEYIDARFINKIFFKKNK